MTTILVSGLCTVDFLFEVDNLPHTGEKYVANNASRIAGGGALNAAIAISRLGGDASLVGRIGRDWAGEFIKQVLAEERINQDLLLAAAHANTAYSVVMVDLAGERQITNFRGRNLSTEAPSLAMLDDNGTDILAALSDTRWEPGGMAVLEKANSCNKPAVVDAEAPLCSTLLKQATHIAFSMQGLQDYDSALNPSSRSSIAQALSGAQQTFDAWVCVTDGANGVYSLTTLNDSQLKTDFVLHHHPAFQVNAINTLAAGDVWHGAFTLHLAMHHSESEAIEFANAAAAIKCTRAGGGTSAPTFAEVEHFTKNAQ